MQIKYYYIGFVCAMLLLGCVAYFVRKQWYFKGVLAVPILMLTLICIELASMLAIHTRTGIWVYDIPYNQNIELFEPHPYMVGMPRKGASVTIGQHRYTNNSQGFRGDEFLPRSTKKRVVVVGASTSYGVGVNDNQTWPHYLDSLLGDGFEVLNTAVPGHTTLEHIMFASTMLPELDPDVVLIHAGLNDLRNLNIKDVAADYTDFHAPSFAGSLGFSHLNGLPPIATLHALISIMERMGWYPIDGFRQVPPPVMEKGNHRAFRLFNRNLRTLTAVCNQTGAELIMVPQVIKLEKVQGRQLWWWMPYLDDEEIVSGIDSCNAIMQKVAADNNLRYTQNMTQEMFSVNDYGDPSHLNATGNMKFAQVMAQTILAVADSARAQ